MEITLSTEPESIRLDTRRTALIVVDMQNSFCKQDGMMDYFGKLKKEMAERVIKVNKKVIEACRAAGIKIIYLRMTYNEALVAATGPESPFYWKEGGLVAMRKNPELSGRFLTPGTWDREIVDELKPGPDDIIVDKGRYSGFVNTKLDSVLKSFNIKYMLFTGVFTNVCVESTLRDALFHEYFPVLVSDGCGNTGPEYTQQATIWNVQSIFGWVTTSDDLIKSIK
jgi:ureidoacrylate peracid hydrolase